MAWNGGGLDSQVTTARHSDAQIRKAERPCDGGHRGQETDDGSCFEIVQYRCYAEGDKFLYTDH